MKVGDKITYEDKEYEVVRVGTHSFYGGFEEEPSVTIEKDGKSVTMSMNTARYFERESEEG